ncbi:hypothetical protein TruAng_005888 [Truncatella angustata]|nr:hypothetical protein TruAng_005888 [Truncatella angustata]
MAINDFETVDANILDMAMAALASEPGGRAVVPSYEAILSAHQSIHLTRDAKRLYWTLSGPLSTAIWVMEETFYHPDFPLEPYYCPATSEMGAASWSPVSQSPLTDPKISSVTVRVDHLENWEDQWYDVHREHTEPDWDHDENDMFRWGHLLDYDPDEDEDGPEHLLKCCGEERPRKKSTSLLVEAKGDFVTIHDYVSAVHPWLMGLRNDILQAAGDVLDSVPLPPNTKLMVNYPGPDSLAVAEEKQWFQARKRTLSHYYIMARMSLAEQMKWRSRNM